MMQEHEKARRWRESRNLSLAQLADLTGYTALSLRWFEKGMTPPKRREKSGRPDDRRISEWVWQRYKRACEGVDHQLRTGRRFDW